MRTLRVHFEAATCKFVRNEKETERGSKKDREMERENTGRDRNFFMFFGFALFL